MVDVSKKVVSRLNGDMDLGHLQQYDSTVTTVTNVNISVCDFSFTVFTFKFDTGE